MLDKRAAYLQALECSITFRYNYFAGILASRSPRGFRATVLVIAALAFVVAVYPPVIVLSLIFRLVPGSIRPAYARFLTAAWRFAIRPPALVRARYGPDIAVESFTKALAGRLPVGTSSEFKAYLASRSTVRIRNQSELIKWLGSCEYTDPPAAPSQRWEVSNFEASRTGKCFERALWAWRMHNEIGMRARLVFGVFRPDQEASRTWTDSELNPNHAWVEYEYQGRAYIFETTARRRSDMIRQRNHVAHQYAAYHSVDADGHVWDSNWPELAWLARNGIIRADALPVERPRRA